MFERLFFFFFCHRIRVQFVFHVAVLLHAIATARTVDVFVPFDPGQSQREVERGRERHTPAHFFRTDPLDLSHFALRFDGCDR